MEDYLYDGLIERISKEFELQLEKIEAEYNFDNGAEFEIAICRVLRKILPTKYGICRGFVVDKQGNKEGDDIIIYDQEKFPTLRFFDEDNAFVQKNQIPVDAVYAYIEAKNTLDEKTFEKAFNQVVKVKKLCYTRTPVLIDMCFIGKHIFNNEYSKQDGWNPIIKNPVYGMILSRHCKNLRGENGTSSEEANEFISEGTYLEMAINTDKINNLQAFQNSGIITANSPYTGKVLTKLNQRVRPIIDIVSSYIESIDESCKHQFNWGLKKASIEKVTDIEFGDLGTYIHEEN